MMIEPEAGNGEFEGNNMGRQHGEFEVTKMAMTSMKLGK